MILQRSSLIGPTVRAELLRQASRFQILGSGRPFHAIPRVLQNPHGSCASCTNFIVETHLKMPIFGNLGPQNVSLPCAMIFKSYIHSGKQAEVEEKGTPVSMDFVKELLQDNRNTITGPRMDSRAGLLQQNRNGFNGQPMNFRAGLYPENGNNVTGRPVNFHPGSFQENGYGATRRHPFYQTQPETNPDVVHIKLMRNNAFVTLTDSKGNKKRATISSGLIVENGGGKFGRYSAEAAAESMGREVRRMKIKSVVVKVNGFTYFKKKKDAILAFKEGYTNARGDVNPIVYIEDTTRKPHNGCRRRKQRRI